MIYSDLCLVGFHLLFSGVNTWKVLDTDSTKGQEYSETNICYKGVWEVVKFTEERHFFTVTLQTTGNDKEVLPKCWYCKQANWHCNLSIYLFKICSSQNTILSIIHVATCFDSKNHHQINRWTISEIHKVIVTHLSSKKFTKVITNRWTFQLDSNGKLHVCALAAITAH